MTNGALTANAPLLELKDITKTFGALAANDHISLQLRSGEVLALLGENGAGKSTLMNIIYGIYHPDSGKILIRGKREKISSPRHALHLGVGMVHQHFMLIGPYTAVENVCLLSAEGAFTLLDKKKVQARLEALKAAYGIDVDLTCPVEQLSISMQQKIEILKLLYTGADILILDEPTAVLLPQECQALFAIIRNMAEHGKGVIFISHKLDEVLQVSDRISVLAHGRICGQMETKDADKSRIVTMMSGENVPEPSAPADKTAPGEVVFACRGAQAFDDRRAKTLAGVDLQVHAGEIVGIAGVEGNGQNELAEVMAGVRRLHAGTLTIHGEALHTKAPGDFIRHGIGYIPADRNTVGTVPEFRLYENWLLRRHAYPQKHKLIDKKAVQRQALQAMQEFDVRTTGCMERSANLSGGNLQKFILARELKKHPKLLICSYPTRGLDVKAAYFVREQILKARRRGAGVVLFSGDLEELFAVSDRIVVLNHGQVVGEKAPAETTFEEITLMMMGETCQTPGLGAAK